MLVCHRYCSLFIFYANHGKPTQPGYASCQWLISSVPEQNEADWSPDVRRFITAKQFETTSLHSLSQNLRVNDFRWLHGNNRSGQRVAPGEMKKRKELVLDLIHWIFECFLIPLIKVSTEGILIRYLPTTDYRIHSMSQKRRWPNMKPCTTPRKTGTKLLSLITEASRTTYWRKLTR